MARLVELAGMGTILIGLVWMVIAAFQHGFWTGLFELFHTVDTSRHRHRHDTFLSRHWDDAKGPFWTIVVGACLMLVSKQL